RKPAGPRCGCTNCGTMPTGRPTAGSSCSSGLFKPPPIVSLQKAGGKHLPLSSNLPISVMSPGMRFASQNKVFLPPERPVTFLSPRKGVALMTRMVLASLAVLALSAGSLRAADEKKKTEQPIPQATTVKIVNIDAKKGEITLKFNDQGKEGEKTFKL